MNNSLQIFTLYLALVTFGSAFSLPFFPNKITGKSFPRFYYGLIILFFGLFLFCLYRLEQFHINQIWLFAFGFWVFATTFTKDFKDFEIYLYKVFALFSLIWFVLYVKKALYPTQSFFSVVPEITLLFIAFLFLSFYLMTMIFGHWYLVNRKLPISYLIKICSWLIVVTVLRTIASAYSLVQAYVSLSPEQFDRIFDFYAHGIFFWARVLAGLGIPLLVSVLSYKSAKIGSNQSATGILYAGVVFVLMGEFLALYLLAITGFLF